MKFDIFFSISQTPKEGVCPSEKVMFSNFFEQIDAADRLGFRVAWVAESHLSSEVQKLNRRPVIPHWAGEVGLNGDIYQLAQKIFSRTKRIEVGSAVANILCNGGPIAHAERLATFATLHGANDSENRRLHMGFAAGRFDFCSRATGIVPRNDWEELAWPVVKSYIFREASEIFLKLFRGDILSSDEIPEYQISRSDFRDENQWNVVKKAAATELGNSGSQDTWKLSRRWTFEKIKIIPQDFRRDLVQMTIGSHEPQQQEYVNQIWPVQVFNLSITKPEIIEDTHRRMARSYHKNGGPWQRSFMPRTTFVFLNEQPGLSKEERRLQAQAEAREALGAYWNALEGTLDSKKVSEAADNALVGNADDIVAQVRERFHPEDRLMLWFDFFNHDSARVIQNMENFMKFCAPQLQDGAEINL